MKIESVKAVYFSPTGNSKKIALAAGIKISKILKAEFEGIDFTSADKRNKKYIFSENDIVVFVSPVYAGRLPNKIMPFIENGFEGNNAIGIPVVTYGNRNYDNALIELCDILEKNKFRNIAAMAIVGEHAFSDNLAKGRPNDNDIEKIKEFVSVISKKILECENIALGVEVKGDKNYSEYYTPLGEDKKPAKFLKAKPKTLNEKCTNCGICAQKCPMNSIDFNDFSLINGICIKCQACIKSCPNNAKYFDDEAFLSHVKMLEKEYGEYKENEFFIIE